MTVVYLLLALCLVALATLAASVRNAVVQGISRREQQALKTYLRKVIANLEMFATKAGGERDVHGGGAA